jgi:hypothetical protein
MPKPNLFIVGAPKCGTTAMYEYLKAHPEIFMHDRIKEPHYFAKEFQVKGMDKYKDEKTYLSIFEAATDEKWIGEASVLYLYSEEAAQNIWEFNPNAKIIIMLRNPVDMLYSLYYQYRFSGNEIIGTFEGALAAEADRKRGIGIPMHARSVKKFFYRDIACYHVQVQRYFARFGRENVHVIIYDDFKEDTANVYQETLEFLNVSTDFEPEFTVVNSSKIQRFPIINRLTLHKPPGWYVIFMRITRLILPHTIRYFVGRTINRFNQSVRPRPPMKPKIRQELQTELKNSVDQLSALLGYDLTLWYQDE